MGPSRSKSISDFIYCKKYIKKNMYIFNKFTFMVPHGHSHVFSCMIGYGHIKSTVGKIGNNGKIGQNGKMVILLN